jgi:DNA-binding CsgD family transcriptional regulator
MISKKNPLRVGLGALLAKTLENALAHRIEKEFPRIGGPRICKLCAEMILEVVHGHIRSKQTVCHGQILWTAVSIDDRPGWSQKIADTDLVPVLLDVSTAQDIQSRIDGVHPRQIRLRKAVRMCHQAYEQGGLLTNYDLSEILNISDSIVGQLLAEYERQNNTVVPRRGTIHDAGSSVSHKGIICRKRYVEGKSADQIARETYHSIEAVDRYLGQFDRVRHCHRQGLRTIETAHILNCSVSLVKAYRQIDQELEGENA